MSTAKAPAYIAVVPLRERLVVTLKLDDRSLTLVDTESAVQLAESNHATRYYFPKSAIQPAFQVRASQADKTYCPYKGFASYFDLTLDGRQLQQLGSILWSYSDPFPGSHAEPIRGLLCLAAPATSNSVSLELSVGGKLLSSEDCRSSCSKLLQEHARSEPAPKQTREAEEQRTQRGQRQLMPPSLKRTPSSTSADPRMYPAAQPSGAELHPDSTNPILADMIYHLDDEARGEYATEPTPLVSQKDEEAIDEHLAWFKDEPWYSHL